MHAQPEPIWPDAPRYGPPDPFPPYRFVPGEAPHPTRDPAGHSYIADESSNEPGAMQVPHAPHVPHARWREETAYLRGVDLYHAGYLWEAHEAWEGIWKATRDDLQREYLQGLIQLAAMALKQHVGQQRGATILRKAAHLRLAHVNKHHDRYMGLALAPVVTSLASPAEHKPPPRLELAGA